MSLRLLSLLTLCLWCTGLTQDDASTSAQSQSVSEPALMLSVEPEQPVAGSEVTITYEGAPTGAGGWLALAPVDAATETYLEWAYAPGTNGQVTLRLPDEALRLEARYYVDLPTGGLDILARSEPFNVQAATASLMLPEEIIAGSSFEIGWEGPDGEGDYLTIVEPGTSRYGFGSWAYTQDGAFLSLLAPETPGFYELRYVTGQSYQILASQIVEVMPIPASELYPGCNEPPSEATLEAAFHEKVDSAVATAQLAYGNMYEDISYSYNISSISLSETDGDISASYSASVTEVSTGNPVDISGTLAASFTWINCAWSLEDFSY